MKIEVSKVDMGKVNALLSDIKGGANLALSRAINKGVSHGQTQAVKSIGQYLNLKAARIKKDFEGTFKAKKNDLSAGIVATGQPVGLLNFGALPRKGGYSVKVKKKGARKFLKHAFKAKTTKPKKDGSTYETEHLWWRINYGGTRTNTGTENTAFFASLPSGHFYKNPLERLEGPRIEDVFAKPGIYDPIRKMAEDKVTEQLMVQVDTILRRHNG